MTSSNDGTSDAIITDWICSCLTLVILLARLASDKITCKRTGISSYLAGFSAVILVARSACDTVYLDFGTVDNVLSDPSSSPVDSAELARLQTGSILALVCRLLITTFYWLQCCLLLMLYHRLLGHIPRIWLAIRICWATVAVTYVVVILLTFLECRPFRLYYQLHPNPGRCILAYGQLLAQGVSNIVIDFLLLTISFPILRLKAAGTAATVRLAIIYLFGTFAIIVSCVRIALTYNDDSNQVQRSIWASIQGLTAALVANVSSIYGGIMVLRRRRRPDPDAPESPEHDGLALMDTSEKEKTTPAAAHHEFVEPRR